VPIKRGAEGEKTEATAAKRARAGLSDPTNTHASAGNAPTNFKEGCASGAEVTQDEEAEEGATERGGCQAEGGAPPHPDALLQTVGGRAYWIWTDDKGEEFTVVRPFHLSAANHLLGKVHYALWERTSPWIQAMRLTSARSCPSRGSNS
jgi:hypothetical protein